MSLPTAREINPIVEDLDGRAAEGHFLGKRVEDAVRLFEANSLYYLEDLQWMGPKAFCYYLAAAVIYLKSEAGKGDGDTVRGLGSIIYSRLQDDASLITQARPAIRELADYVIENYKRFDPSLSFYRNVVESYKKLLRDLSGEPGTAPNDGPAGPLGNSGLSDGPPSVS